MGMGSIWRIRGKRIISRMKRGLPVDSCPLSVVGGELRVGRMSTVIEQHESTSAEGVEAPQLIGLLAEFESVEAVVAGAEKVREAGYRRWDVHSPFPIHGIDEVMGIRPTRLPWLVLGAGLFGLAGGIGMQWFANAFDYQYMVSGKPIFSLPANIPVAFETTVLC